MMAAAMEVLEIKRVIVNLVDRVAIKTVRPHLELDDKNHTSCRDDDIDSLSHPRDGELEVDPACYRWWQKVAQYLYLPLPCMCLLMLQRKAMTQGERSQNRSVIGREEILYLSVVVCSHGCNIATSASLMGKKRNLITGSSRFPTAGRSPLANGRLWLGAAVAWLSERPFKAVEG